MEPPSQAAAPSDEFAEAERISRQNRRRFKRDLIDPQLTPDQVTQYYDDWAGTYDDTMYTGQVGYTSWTDLCQTLTQLLPPGVDKAALPILDVGCGTGIVGRQLRDLGFDNVDGVDGSAGMVERAAQLGIFRRTFVELVEDRSLAAVPRAAYDAVVCKGAFMPNHVRPSALPFVGELLRRDGLLCVEIRRVLIEGTDTREFEPEAKKMEAAGGWKILRWRQESAYNLNVPGFIYVLQKL